MKIAEIRRVINSAAWVVNDYQGHTREEFMRADVGASMARKIAELKALNIAPRFASDLAGRDSLIARCERLAARWASLRSAPAPTPCPAAFSPPSAHVVDLAAYRGAMQ